MDTLVIRKLDSYVRYVCHIDWIYVSFMLGMQLTSLYQNKALEITIPQPKSKFKL